MGALIKTVTNQGKVWAVDYEKLVGCCSFKRFTLIFEQKKKPTTKQIENAINNQDGK